MTANVTRAWVKSTKRGPKMAHGRVPSQWIIELNNDKVKRRVYEDWSAFRKGQPVPLVVIVGDEKLPVSTDQITAGLAEAERRFNNFLSELN